MNTLQQMEEGSRFYIYFFDREVTPLKSSIMLEPTPGNLQRAQTFIDDPINKRGWGDKGIVPAMEGAFGLDPTEIWLLSDGGGEMFSKNFAETGVLETLNKLNAGKEVKVYTLGIGDDIRGGLAETLLDQIAKENGGAYLWVDPDASAPAPAPQE